VKGRGGIIGWDPNRIGGKGRGSLWGRVFFPVRAIGVQ